MGPELVRQSRKMLPLLEREIRVVLKTRDNGQAQFYGMIHYHMGWVDSELQITDAAGGKRIRPLLCLLTCAASGRDWQMALPAAAAVEILHNFSLVHDDIEDSSPTRRGQPTMWHLWGIPQAINTGDAMFALAHLALAQLEERGVAPAVVVQALRRFDETSVRLTEGQYADMSFEERDEIAVAEYMAMIGGKTAVLLSLCAELGALIGDCPEPIVYHYASFGLELGLAFQVKDDILGIWGDESVTGKSAATDIVTRKKTLPVLYGLARSERLRQLYKRPDFDTHMVPETIRLLEETGARQFAEKEAAIHSELALEHLVAAGGSEPAYQALGELADMLLQRDY